jgi:hypothetical protein
MRIEQHQKGEGDFRTTRESLISLASRAAELFERSKPEQKRQLLAFVFSNLQLREKTRGFMTFALRLDGQSGELFELAGAGGLELRNVVAKYPIERSHRFREIRSNSGY